MEGHKKQRHRREPKKMPNKTATRLWKYFVSQPPETRHLDLCRSNSVVRSSSLQYLVTELKLLDHHERPKQLTISPSHYHISGSAASASYVSELFQLCTQSLEKLNINWSHSEEESHCVVKAIAEGTVSLQNLVSLTVVSADLSNDGHTLDVFGSPDCKIRSFTIYYEGNDDQLLQVLESYNGLTRLKIDKVPMANEETENFIQAITNSPSQLTHLTLPFLGIENSNLDLVAKMVEAQKNLQLLDLSHNPLFQVWADNAFETTNTSTETFCKVIGQHSSLEQLVLLDCHWNTETFLHLLRAVEQSHTLEKLHLSSIYGRKVRIEQTWLEYLPRLKNLKALYGLDRLLGTEQWKAEAVPYVRRNTSLSKLSTSGGSKLSLIDAETSGILARNQLLDATNGYKTTVSIPALNLWPKLLERLAERNVERSALFSFLQEKIHEHPEGRG